MVFTSPEDFYDKVSCFEKITREEEREIAARMRMGDTEAFLRIKNNYLIYVAAYIRRLPGELATVALIYKCICELDKEIERFDFLNDGESFSHRLGTVLRRTVTAHIAEK